MMTSHLGPSADLPAWAVWLACCLAMANLALLVVEMRRGKHGGAATAVTGLLAISMLLAAVVRPARVSARETRVGARVLVLADTSRSMSLVGDDGRTRRAVRDDVVDSLRSRGRDARLAVLGFGDGAPVAMTERSKDTDATARASHSDLGAAIRALASSPEERPAAVVVVSDGRLDDPPEDASESALKALGDTLHVPIDTIATTRNAPADASVRRVSAAGAAVAHVPLSLRVEVGCAGGLACDDVTVTARELREGAPATSLASGVAHIKDGKATLDLTITLERAGARLVEVAIDRVPGDTIPANDRRIITFDVTRERVRVLHVAGEPTNDVRALRQWLKSDLSIDVVAFFILRTPTDDVHASQNDLALIPFPVDELFTEHLPSFDAVVLQDFDAQPYGLEKYLDNLRRYVRGGGGLVMVGGQNSFVAGGYAGTPLADVLPINLDGSTNATGADTSPFTPQWTREGEAAPLLAPLRDVLGDDLPVMAGANVLGDVRPGGVALWSHPARKTSTGASMPVLAVGDEGDGRTIALGVDGTWGLKFSELGAKTGGRGHGALWDGLLGWLMRDPRFETAQMAVLGGCTVGEPVTMHATLLPSAGHTVSRAVVLDVTRIDQVEAPLRIVGQQAPDRSSIDLVLPALAAGAYTARLHVGGGPIARYDFACEAGGDEWADSRPDAERLASLARATGGSFVFASDAASLALPKPTIVNTERHVTPVAPAWLWSFAAAAMLGAHWVSRRRFGLS
jgi:uncharacterized membrane protein